MRASKIATYGLKLGFDDNKEFQNEHQRRVEEYFRLERHSSRDNPLMDTDIDLGGFGRLSPHKKWRPLYRWQHIYLWFLYGFLVLKRHLFDDFKSIITGRINAHLIPRPRGGDLLIFITGIMAFFTLAFGIPLLSHSLEAVSFWHGCIHIKSF